MLWSSGSFYTDSTILCNLADIVGYLFYSEYWLLLDISCYRIRTGIVVAAVEAVPEPPSRYQGTCQLAQYEPWHDIPRHDDMSNKQTSRHSKK